MIWLIVFVMTYQRGGVYKWTEKNLRWEDIGPKNELAHVWTRHSSGQVP